MMSAQISYFKNTYKYRTGLIKSSNMSLIYMYSVSLPAASFSVSQLRMNYFCYKLLFQRWAVLQSCFAENLNLAHEVPNQEPFFSP